MKVKVGNNQEMAHTEVHTFIILWTCVFAIVGHRTTYTANGIFLHNEKVQVGNDLENAKSERNSHSKNRGGKN